MATGKWIIAEDIRECGCLMIGYLNEDDTTRVDMHYCPKHKAAPELYEALVMLVSSAGAVGWMMADDALALADGDV